MPAVTFLPSGLTVTCADGDSVFETARRNAIPVETACVGKATCGLCRIKIIDGEQHLTPFNDAERKHLGNVYFLTKVRLSCQARLQGGDVTVELAPKRAPKPRATPGASPQPTPSTKPPAARPPARPPGRAPKR